MVTPQPLNSSGFFVFCGFVFLHHENERDRMKELTIDIAQPESQPLPSYIREELANYEEQIGKYRAGEVDETKMQKLRLHFGTYAQRQEGVQMQRIKIPGGFLSADQLACLADASSPRERMRRSIT